MTPGPKNVEVHETATQSKTGLAMTATTEVRVSVVNSLRQPPEKKLLKKQDVYSTEAHYNLY